MDAFPLNNLTFQILDAAAKGGYSVGAYNCYNDDGVISVIQAAESCKSPAIIQLFPWTMKFQGPQFVKYVIEAAHAASVPIAVHLDHCIEPADVEAALELPFDSIMVDASILEPEENIKWCKAIVERANAKGIAIEAEMGRIEGGEDGLPSVDMDTILTQPEQAREFVTRTGVQFLAPSFGNIHGNYGAGGPEASWRLPLLMEVHEAVPQIPLVLHGTHGISDELFRKIRRYGMVKVNLNRTVRDDYTRFVAENAGKLELTVLKMEGVKIYRASIERVMRDVLESPLLLKMLINKSVLKETPKEVVSWKILAYCIILSFSGALHGFNTANISGVLAMSTFQLHFGLNDMSTSTLADWTGWITSVLILGSCLGSLVCAPFTDKLGRKASLGLFTVIFTVSAVLMSANPGHSSGRIEFLVGRAVSGFGSGAASVVGTGYIAEIAPQSIRGGLTALYNANTMLSVGLAYWINYGSLQNISSTSDSQWQVPMGVQALPGVILLVGLFFIPESPRWLISHGKLESAQLALEDLRSLPRDHSFVRQEFEDIQAKAEEQSEIPGLKGIFSEIFSKSIRKRMIMVMIIQVGFQFSGGNIITYYNTSILTSIGLTAHGTNYLFSGIYGLIKFLAVLLYCLFVIDRFGRRVGLFTGSALIIGSLLYLTVYLAVAKPSADSGTGPAGWVAVVCIYIFAIGYAISWGTIPWIINAEVGKASLKIVEARAKEPRMYDEEKEVVALREDKDN
ncbi:hypothetical protein G7Z17_g7874 [Cylindrodendrum hubeiense]|uniref:Major facilitator superfamily (MFS) profile domain-containing protein n=1 Tax=Cylindrodendrum hubeiense TaxID=595255 RepID=A0A9P5HAN3_9HYPO|nr:hypothetical protein G7Z17_g7874 [Cylindrodendrum hubeiense]